LKKVFFFKPDTLKPASSVCLRCFPKKTKKATELFNQIKTAQKKETAKLKSGQNYYK
jgi:hypothetical protein